MEDEYARKQAQDRAYQRSAAAQKYGYQNDVATGEVAAVQASGKIGDYDLRASTRLGETARDTRMNDILQRIDAIDQTLVGVCRIAEGIGDNFFGARPEAQETGQGAGIVPGPAGQFGNVTMALDRVERNAQRAHELVERLREIA